MSIFKKKNSEKANGYISASDSRKISRFNRKLTARLEKERDNAAKDPALYTTKMKDANNVVEFDNVCTYFFTDIGTVKAVDGVSFDIYEGETGRSMTVRLTFSSNEKTLSKNEVQGQIDLVLARLAEKNIVLKN